MALKTNEKDKYEMGYEIGTTESDAVEIKVRVPKNWPLKDLQMLAEQIQLIYMIREKRAEEENK